MFTYGPNITKCNAKLCLPAAVSSADWEAVTSTGLQTSVNTRPCSVPVPSTESQCQAPGCFSETRVAGGDERFIELGDERMNWS